MSKSNNGLDRSPVHLVHRAGQCAEALFQQGDAKEGRPMAKIVVVAFALVLSTFLFAKAGPSWTGQVDSALCRLPFPAAEATWDVADVLCCCKTHTGGECCMRAAQCGGKPPGCFCASPSVPGALQRTSMARRSS